MFGIENIPLLKDNLFLKTLAHIIEKHLILQIVYWHIVNIHVHEMQDGVSTHECTGPQSNQYN